MIIIFQLAKLMIFFYSPNIFCTFCAFYLYFLLFLHYKLTIQQVNKDGKEKT